MNSPTPPEVLPKAPRKFMLRDVPALLAGIAVISVITVDHIRGVTGQLDDSEQPADSMLFTEPPAAQGIVTTDLPPDHNFDVPDAAIER